MSEVSIKKMPCSMRKDGAASLRSEHLVPCLTKEKPVFIGIKSGKEYDKGCISYLGVKVSSDDILKKLKLPKGEAIKARPILDEYLKQINQFKIGNVVSVSWGQDTQELELIKEAERPPSGEKKLKLP